MSEDFEKVNNQDCVTSLVTICAYNALELCDILCVKYRNIKLG